MTNKLISSHWLLQISAGFLRYFFPVLRIGNWVVISRFQEVRETLLRSGDFTIAQINAGKMKETDLDFFLGMDSSPVHDREKQVMELITKHEDLLVIQNLVAEESSKIISSILSEGKIEVVGTLSRAVPLSFIEHYLGIPVEDKNRMQYWMRALFHQLFLNLTDDAQVRQEGLTAAAELKEYMERVITEADSRNDSLPDSLLSRLFKLRSDFDFIDYSFIRRNICGLMIGAVDTTSKCAVLVMEELLNRPDQLKEATNFAWQNNIVELRKYCYEALRFNPHNPIVVRYTPHATRIGKNGKYSISANRKVAIGIYSAMHDASEFISPGEFKTDRKNEYLHFGYGMHICYGRYINAVQISEIVAALLRLKNLRTSSINRGKVKYDGPFPDAFYLEFDKQKAI